MLVLLIELAVRPVVYGFWLDICMLPLLGGSIEGRLALLQHAPVSWTLLHWLLGMACLMATATFLSTARSLLRPGPPPSPLLNLPHLVSCSMQTSSVRVQMLVRESVDVAFQHVKSGSAAGLMKISVMSCLCVMLESDSI